MHVEQQLKHYKLISSWDINLTRVEATGTAERNLEWGDPWSKAEGAIHLGGSERIGPGKF